MNIKTNQIQVINIKDENYPQLLKQIYNPPKEIYVIGNKEILKEKSIAIVGCRDATEYGKKAAKYFAYKLAKKGIHIISGLAKGVDSYAHIGAITAQTVESYPQTKLSNSKTVERYPQLAELSTVGKTIAVFGCGLDTIYPKENIELAKEIIKTGGTIISEYQLGTRPEKNNFPQRNRIISGLSQGVLVIEAKEKSGSLITADFALEQGKEVYAVPGNINSLHSVGTNMLIKQGAKLVTHYSEIEI